MRYFLDIAYKGKHYHGWQIQPNAISVQQVLENALSTLLREKIQVTGAGRTDTGVHAKQLIVHFDIETLDDLIAFQHRLNSFLPSDIAINDIKAVQKEAHARFDAVEREYEYLLITQKNPFLSDSAFLLNRTPDFDKMNQAAALLLDHQDFQCFSRSGSDVKTYHCDVRKARWEKRGDAWVFTIAADRFLRNMVRAVVGTLLEVGLGKMDMDQFRQVLLSKDRSKAGASAPAHGLYLVHVNYPENIYLD
ncbi:tRNA pseudouridine(38-40) synthase TruA [Aureitalea marina]|uniref:tRNA pseudouridine synthase A n=1 Tax=Aureitalea marina TaxID=930804 RepID=A0A2S7KMC4_9FLAO|nr:tRNA pseudouridine(38-40) synthase TruA [Aureitalea marina]PQB03785.1 tRNA pseudouridine(38-40) synthase TruA [Aureitalea marina]